jgi:hypothetical protein
MDPIRPDVFVFDWSYPIAFFLGLFVLASLVGWGQAVGKCLILDARRENFGWGLAAAWGLATFLVLSGPMLMLSIFSTLFVTFFLLAGLILLARHTYSTRGRRKAWNGPPTIGLKAFFIVLCLFVLLNYATAVATHWYNPYDDFTAYFAHVKMLLDTGTLRDPFSFRLLGSLGGQAALDTLVLTFLPWKYAHLLDLGLAGLIMLVLTQEMVPGDNRKAWIARLLLLALALTFSMPRINTASEFTGVILFMALLRSFDLVATCRTCDWKAWLLLSGTMAATATLRCHNVFIVALLGLGFFVWRFREGKDRWKIIGEALAMLVMATAMLAPWWIVSYQSSGTFLYPLFKGTQRPEFETFNLHLPLSATFQFIEGFFVSTNYLLLFLPICLLEAGRQRQILLILGGTILLLSIAFLSQFTYGAYTDINRYLAPIGLAFGLYTANVVAQQLVAAHPSPNLRFPALRSKLVVTFAVTLILLQGVKFLADSIVSIVRIQWAIDAKNQMCCDRVGSVFTDDTAGDYKDAFARIPVGAKTLIALDYPFLLDYRAHSIFSIDVAGAASPAPGFPYFQGAAPVKKYLSAQGIHYIAHVPFNHAKFLYSREVQNNNLAGPVPMWHFYATFTLDFFHNIDQLAKSNRILYDSPTIRIIALEDE